MACSRTDDRLTLSLFPGWACCQCKTYNGFQRVTCKTCGHSACYFANPKERLPYLTKDMAGRKVIEYVDPPSSTRDPRTTNTRQRQGSN